MADEQMLHDVSGDTLKELLLQQLSATAQGKSMRDLMQQDVSRYGMPAPVESTIAPNPQAQAREQMLQKLLSESQQDPTTQLLDRVKRITGGAENEQQYVDQRFTKQYGSSKVAHAANFLSDILRTATGKDTLLEKVQSTAGSEFKTMLSEASQGLQQERAQNSQQTQLLTQLRGYDKQDQDRRIEEARLGVKGRAQDIQAQYQKTMAAVQAAKEGDASSNALRDDILSWTQQKFGKTPDEQDWKGVYEDLVRSGMSEGEAHLKTQALKAALKMAGQRPISTGTDRTVNSTVNDAGVITGQTTSTQRRFDRPTGGIDGGILQQLLGGKAQTNTQQSLQQLLQQPQTTVRPGINGIIPPKVGDAVFKSVDAAKKYSTARQTANAQAGLANELITGGLASNDKGMPTAASWTGPVNGSDFFTTVREAMGKVTPEAALAKIDQIMIPFATARQAVAGRVSNYDAQTAQRSKPSAWQLYRNQVVLAAANALRMDFDAESLNPSSGVPAKLSVEQEQKLAGEVIRILDGVAAITHGFDFSKPLDNDAKKSIQNSLQVRPIRDVLASPKYNYEQPIPAAARSKIIPARR